MVEGQGSRGRKCTVRVSRPGFKLAQVIPGNLGGEVSKVHNVLLWVSIVQPRAAVAQCTIRCKEFRKLGKCGTFFVPKTNLDSCDPICVGMFSTEVDW